MERQIDVGNRRYTSPYAVGYSVPSHILSNATFTGLSLVRH